MPNFRLGSSSDGDEIETGSRGLDEAYLSVINLMACIGGEQEVSEKTRGHIDGDGKAWLLSATKGAKRKVVTISDIRKEWQRELDRRSVVEAGRWGFGLGNGDEMELG